MGVMFAMSPSTAMAGHDSTGDVNATVTARFISIQVVENNVGYDVLDTAAAGNEPTGQDCATTTGPAFTVTNNGNTPENFLIKGFNSTPGGWVLAGVQAANQYVHSIAINPTTCTFVPLTTSDVTYASNVAATTFVDMYLQLDMPNSSTSTVEQTLQITVTAVAA